MKLGKIGFISNIVQVYFFSIVAIDEQLRLHNAFVEIYFLVLLHLILLSQDPNRLPGRHKFIKNPILSFLMKKN